MDKTRMVAIVKTVKKENGWDEVETKCVRFNGFCSKEFLTVQKLIESNERLGRKRGLRCQYCHTSWKGMDGSDWVALVQTTQGNKLLCSDCFETFNLEGKNFNNNK